MSQFEKTRGEIFSQHTRLLILLWKAAEIIITAAFFLMGEIESVLLSF